MGLAALSLVLFAAAATSAAAPGGLAPPAPDVAAADIESAVMTGRQEVLEAARVRLRSEDAGLGPDGPALYLRAYVAWRLSYFHPRGSERSQTLLEEAETDLERLLGLDPGDAEALALHGAVAGSRITGAWSGLRHGPRAARSLDRAVELAPENPRVTMLLGISRLFRPGPFGGGVGRAVEELERALELFAREPAGRPWPNWGRAEVFAWLGQTSLRQGDLEGAAALYQQALAIEPDYHWVRQSLLPEIEEKRMARSEGPGSGSRSEIVAVEGLRRSGRAPGRRRRARGPSGGSRPGLTSGRWQRFPTSPPRASFSRFL